MSRRAKSKPTPDHKILKILTISFSHEKQLKPRGISRPINNQPDRTHRQFHSHPLTHITRCMQTTWPFELLKLYPLKQDTKVRNRSPLNPSSPSRDRGDQDWFRPFGLCLLNMVLATVKLNIPYIVGRAILCMYRSVMNWPFFGDSFGDEAGSVFVVRFGSMTDWICCRSCWVNGGFRPQSVIRE